MLVLGINITNNNITETMYVQQVKNYLKRKTKKIWGKIIDNHNTVRVERNMYIKKSPLYNKINRATDRLHSKFLAN